MDSSGFPNWAFSSCEGQGQPSPWGGGGCVCVWGGGSGQWLTIGRSGPVHPLNSSSEAPANCLAPTVGL